MKSTIILDFFQFSLASNNFNIILIVITMVQLIFNLHIYVVKSIKVLYKKDIRNTIQTKNVKSIENLAKVSWKIIPINIQDLQIIHNPQEKLRSLALRVRSISSRKKYMKCVHFKFRVQAIIYTRICRYFAISTIIYYLVL